MSASGSQGFASHRQRVRGGDGGNHHIRALDVLVVVRALEAGVETIHRSGFGEVEGLALRGAFGDVEEHHVAEFLDGGEMGERAADLAGTA